MEAAPDERENHELPRLGILTRRPDETRQRAEHLDELLLRGWARCCEDRVERVIEGPHRLISHCVIEWRSCSERDVAVLERQLGGGFVVVASAAATATSTSTSSGRHF